MRQLEQGSGHERRGKQVRNQSKRKRDGKATNRSGPELKQACCRQQRGHVSVEQGHEHSAERRPDGAARRLAGGELLFHPLEHEHVGVHAHSDRQYQPRDARERQCRAHVRDEVELARLADSLVTLVDETMQPTHVSLWLSKASRKGGGKR